MEHNKDKEDVSDAEQESATGTSELAPDNSVPAKHWSPRTGRRTQSVNAEAARWRKQFREAEQQRDELATRVEACNGGRPSSLTTTAGVKPQAVWVTTALDALIGEDGTVSTDLVTEAVAAVAEPGMPPSEGQRRTRHRRIDGHTSTRGSFRRRF